MLDTSEIPRIQFEPLAPLCEFARNLLLAFNDCCRREAEESAADSSAIQPLYP